MNQGQRSCAVFLVIYSLRIHSDVAGTSLAHTPGHGRKAVGPMKFESIFIAILLMGGTNLFVRVLTQGIEPALAATALEWSVRRIRAAIRLVRSDRWIG